MLPNPKGKRDLLAMEVTLKYTKGWKKKLNPLVFARNYVYNALLTFSVGKRTSLLFGRIGLAHNDDVIQ